MGDHHIRQQNPAGEHNLQVGSLLAAEIKAVHFSFHLSPDLPSRPTDGVCHRVMAAAQCPVDQLAARYPMPGVVRQRQALARVLVPAQRTVVRQRIHRAGRQRPKVEAESCRDGILDIGSPALRLSNPPLTVSQRPTPLPYETTR